MNLLAFITKYPPLQNAGADLSVVAHGGEYDGKRPYEVASAETQSVFHVFMFERLALGDAAGIERLIDGGIAVDWADDSAARNTTLHWACSFGNLDVAEIILTHGCAVDVRNAVQRTPLHLACKELHMDVIALLLEEGANPISADVDGKTPADLIPAATRAGAGAVAGGSGSGSSSGGGGVAVEEESRADRIRQMLASAPADPPRRCHARFLQREREREEHLRALAAQQRRADVPMQHNQQQHQQQQRGDDDYSEDGDDEHRAMLSSLLYSKQDLEVLASPAVVAGNGVGASNSSSGGGVGNGDSNGKQRDTKNVLLIFWPPVKQQSCSERLSPLLLSSDENLLICVGSIDIDIFPLLTWSGLMDVMDVFGFQVQVKRSSLGARLRLGIDPNLCPGRHSYSLQVGQNQILLLAADTTALLYGVYTLIQLLQLHSDVQSENGITTVAVPPISIRDSPDIPDRGVLWSYREHTRCSSTRMRSHVELLSRFRINKLFLVLDASSEPLTGEDGGGGGGGGAHLTGSNNSANSPHLTTLRRDDVRLLP